MYLSRMVSAFGRSSAAARAETADTSSATPIQALRLVAGTFIMCLTSRPWSCVMFSDPINRGIQDRILPCEQLAARRTHFLIGRHANAFERLAALRDVIGNGVLESVAVGQPFDNGWQRRAGGARAENPRPAHVFQ